MKINHDIILKLLFEEYRVTLAAVALEELQDDAVLYIGDVCVHGSDIFLIVLEIMGFQDIQKEEVFEYYYTPFLKISMTTFDTQKIVETHIKTAYDWLVAQVGKKPPENLKPPVFF